MNDIEKRARELLVVHLRANEYFLTAEAMDLGKEGFMPTEIAAAAIIAALTPQVALQEACQLAREFATGFHGMSRNNAENLADELLEALNAAMAKSELLTGGPVNLLGQQNSGVVVAQELDVVPAAALGADEAGAVGIGGQGDQSLGIQLAEVASEHGEGVLPANDGHVTRGTPQQTLQLVAFESYITEAMNRIVETGEGEPVWLNRHNAEAILAAIAPQWQPIKFNEDGQPTNVPEETPILVPPTKRLGITVAKWSRRDGWETETTSEWVGMYRPTHWMSLPAEPEAPNGSG